MKSVGGGCMAFRESGIAVHENVGAIDSFEKTPAGVRMIFSKDCRRDSAEATLVVVAVGWEAKTAGLSLATAGVETDHRGFVKVDGYGRTSTPHIFAAGDVTGRLMLVPQAIQDGFAAATNAVLGPTTPLSDPSLQSAASRIPSTRRSASPKRRLAKIVTS